MEYWESLAKIGQALVTSTAILVGGFWAYLKFLRGRIYKPRLELDVKCKRCSAKGDLVRLHIQISLKNVGLSRVSIDGESSAVRVHRSVELKHAGLIPDVALESEWHRIGTFPLFVEHAWIEPSEVVQEHKMIEYVMTDPGFKVEAVVMAPTQQWYGTCVSTGEFDGE